MSSAPLQFFVVFSALSTVIVSHNDSADEYEATSVFTIVPFQASAIHHFARTYTLPSLMGMKVVFLIVESWIVPVENG